MILKTHNSFTNFHKVELISNSTSQTKLLRRTNKSRSLKYDRSLSKQSFQNLFPAFFIKNIPKLTSKNNEEEFQTKNVTPVKKVSKKYDQLCQTQKKRLPTPSKSYKQITDYQKTNKKHKADDINFQKQIQIYESQKKLASQNMIRVLIQQKSKQFSIQLSIQRKKAKSLEKQLSQLKERQNQSKQRVKQLQRNLETRNTDLKNTKSNLQKLKDNIKQVRTQDFQNQIKQLKQEVQKLKTCSQKYQKLIDSLTIQNTDLKVQVQQMRYKFQHTKLQAQQESIMRAFKRQIQRLNSQIQTSKNDKQKYLELRILDLQKQLLILRDVSQSKSIQVYCLQRKNHQELQIVKKRKGNQIKSLRIKYSALIEQYKNIQHKRHPSKSKDCRNMSQQKKSTEKRYNRLAFQTRDHEDQGVSFSLSPEYR